MGITEIVRNSAEFLVEFKYIWVCLLLDHGILFINMTSSGVMLARAQFDLKFRAYRGHLKSKWAFVLISFFDFLLFVQGVKL